MPRRKFVIGSSYSAARNWIKRWHLGVPGWDAVIEMNKLRGINPENIEFILLDNHWNNDIFRDNFEFSFYKHLISRGAVENRVYG